jgi:hypothetical protein
MHWVLDWYRGSDWLSLSLGGLFVLIGLIMTLPAGRYFHRRRGPAAGIAFPAVFWAAVLGGGLAVTGGRMSWQSLTMCSVGAAVAVGYSVFLAVRGRGADPGATAPSPEKPALRACPGCGLSVGAGLRRCPACGADLGDRA